jgi:hypothetical protein
MPKRLAKKADLRLQPGYEGFSRENDPKRSKPSVVSSIDNWSPNLW